MPHSELEGRLAADWEIARPLGRGPVEGVTFAGFRDRGVKLDLRVIPQPAVTIVIELGEGGLCVEGADGSRVVGSLAGGLTPAAVRIRSERVDCVEFRLSPLAAYSVLGVGPSDLDGSVIGLDGEGPWNRLRERLAATASWTERFALVEAFLARRRESGSAVDPEVAVTWQRIVAGRGRVRVNELASACGWSRKRLWARFGAQIGLTPKRAAMLVRFDRAVTALSAGVTFGEVAAACGYVDQSHLHRDVRTFAGCTPGALAAG